MGNTKIYKIQVQTGKLSMINFILYKIIHPEKMSGMQCMVLTFLNGIKMVISLRVISMD